MSDTGDRIIRAGQIADAIGKILKTSIAVASGLGAAFCAAIAYASPLAQSDPARFTVAVAAALLLGVAVGVVITLAVSRRDVVGRARPLTNEEIDRMWEEADGDESA